MGVTNPRILSFNEINQLTGLKNNFRLMKDLNDLDFNLLAIVDINQFQLINDTYSYFTGDMVIKKFADFLANEIKDKNIYLYQITGIEYILCSQDKNIEKFRDFIQKLATKLENLELFIDDIQDYVTISITIGVTYQINDFEDFDIVYDKSVLLTQAKIALKYAKEHKLILKEFSEDINSLQDVQNLLFWKDRIKTALENDEFTLVFQPIVNKNGKIIKYESLVRLKEIEENKIKLISPFFFLDIAIQTRQYPKLSHFIISSALNKLKEDTSITLSVNFTYSDILDKKIISLLDSFLTSSSIGDRLIIEIVESEDIKSYELVKEFIKKYKDFGVKIAIDDFGSGFSNFQSIVSLDADYIKIDGSLIKNIDKDINSLAIVKAIVQFAHTLNIKTIAEFVHSKEVLDVLISLDIDEYQGFYFYEPSLEIVKD